MLTAYELADAVLSGRPIPAAPAEAPATAGAVEPKICEAWHPKNARCQRTFFRPSTGKITERPRYCPACR